MILPEKAKTSIRRAAPADNRLLAELGAQTFYDTFAADNTSDNMAAYLASAFNPDKQAAELADPRSIFLIAKMDDEAVGYARLHAGEPPTAVTGVHPIELARIYVVKDWIGNGIGAALMRACLDAAQQRGHDTIWLGVWERNLPAREFYARWGFVQVGSHVFQLGDDPQRDLILQRSV